MRLVSLTAVAVLALAAPAAASTALVNGGITYFAAPGEQNDVTIEPTSGGFRISDPGATITAGNACTTVDAHTVLCDPNTATPPLSIGLGDMNDRVTVPAALGLGSLITGDAGDDVLTGGCNMNGGPGNDVLRGCDHGAFLDGGSGRDALYGGAGNDSLIATYSEAAHDADIIDGGPGEDSLFQGNRNGPTTIDLSNPAAAQGEAGEGTTIAGVEDFSGGSEPDTITGTDGPNRLQGGGGDDVLRGLGGDDTLDGDAGADTIDAGAGDDVITTARDLYVDHVSCGDGADLLPGADARDIVAPDCETVYRQPVYLLFTRRIGMHRDGNVYIAVRLGDRGGGVESFAGTLTLRARVGGRWVRAGRATCSVPTGCSGIYKVTVQKAVARLLLRRRKLDALVTFVRAGGGAIPHTDHATLTVSRLPR